MIYRKVNGFLYGNAQCAGEASLCVSVHTLGVGHANFMFYQVQAK